MCELCVIGAHLLFTFCSGLNSCLELALNLLHSIPYVEASLGSSVLCQALCLLRLSVSQCPLHCAFLCMWTNALRCQFISYTWLHLIPSNSSAINHTFVKLAMFSLCFTVPEKGLFNFTFICFPYISRTMHNCWHYYHGQIWLNCSFLHAASKSEC